MFDAKLMHVHCIRFPTRVCIRPLNERSVSCHGNGSVISSDCAEICFGRVLGLTTDKRSIKIGTLSNVGTFLFVYSSVSRTYIISNVNIDIAMVTMAR